VSLSLGYVMSTPFVFTAPELLDARGVHKSSDEPSELRRWRFHHHFGAITASERLISCRHHEPPHDESDEPSEQGLSAPLRPATS
jgi:hypothetical protein